MPCRITQERGLNRNIEHNSDRIEMKSPSDVNQSPSMLALQVSRVSDSQPFQAEPLLDDEVHKIKRMGGDALIGGIVKHQRPALVGRDHLSRREVIGCPGRFAAPCRSAKDYE